MNDNEKDNIKYIIDEFLETHSTSELLEIVTDSIRNKELKLLWLKV